ncbi:CLUMA_CG012818, isoform A [Clunio marinus]|uniref:CLUMA_CG012818, isoform A n=1 Tax=Clunio marinus TaxID=568069 RepID=A0A1J1IH02_9DIPT|nr:CLUMA_CG012818, isoform A [Clunio marinus]
MTFSSSRIPFLRAIPDLSFADDSENSPTGSTTQLVARGNWGNQIEFILSCLNYAVGLGNVWRFPHLAFRNGGGAFLIPYLLMVFVIGLPIFFAELFIGQYSGLSPIKAYSYISPLFKGVGYCTLLVISYVSIYYMVIIAWVLYYLWTSFFPTLIWGSCDNEWNSENCFSTIEDINCQRFNEGNPSDEIFFRGSCVDIESICSKNGLLGVNVNFCFNQTTNSEVPLNEVIFRRLSSEEFFYDGVLGLFDATWTKGWGFPQGHLVLCLAIGWILVFFCIMKGVQSMGKVVYFTAIFPYFILTALLIRAATLEGAVDGMWFYITPEWGKLLRPAVWGDASSQIFYSFGLACGSLVTFASFNKFKNNCHFDAVFVSLANFMTAVFAGFVVFSILGFLSASMNVPIEDVVASGPGLTFITYPEAVLLMPLPQLWAILFFFMMLILGLGSQFGGVQMMTTSIIDHWPHLREHEVRVTAGTCIACFIAALPMTCNGGVYLFTLMEWHTASWAILLIGFAEVIVLSWVYGMSRTIDNIRDMGMKLRKLILVYWKSVWIVITPIGSVAVLAFILTDLGATEFHGYIFPLWADLIGWMFGLSTLIPMIVLAVIVIVKRKGTIKDLLRPNDKWGPQEVDGQYFDRAGILIKRMKTFHFILFFYLINILGALNQNEILIIVSYDAFRNEYFNRNVTEFTNSLRFNSTRAKYLRNVFPTKTFPNHHSIATGVFPEEHGVMANSLYDFDLEKPLKYSFELFHFKSEIKPIWILNEMSGGRSGCMMWPGSDYEYDGVKCTHNLHYNITVNYTERVDIVFQWILNKESPANLIMFYIEEPDTHAHAFGPESDTITQLVSKLNTVTEYLYKKIKQHNLENRVNVVHLSDHGMDSLQLKNVIDLSKLIGNKKVNYYGTTPILQIVPEDIQDTNFIYDNLVKAAESQRTFKVYLDSTLPERWHFYNKKRVGPITAVADLGYGFQDMYQSAEWYEKAYNIVITPTNKYGVHGYDNAYESMHPIFFAYGHLIKDDNVVNPFDTVDLFFLFCEILGLEPPNYLKGNRENILGILRNMETNKLSRWMVLVMSIFASTVLVTTFIFVSRFFRRNRPIVPNYLYEEDTILDESKIPNIPINVTPTQSTHPSTSTFQVA